MPVNRTDIPYHLTKGLRTIFFDEFKKDDLTGWDRIVTQIPSDSKSETYAWLGSTPTMREWVSERMPKALRENAYSIENKKFEASISVTREALEDDQYGQIKIRTQQLAEAARYFRAERTFEVLVAGTAGTYGTCYDGQFFFDVDHSEGNSGTQSNDGTSALTSASLSATRAAMARFKDDQGKSMGIIGDTLIVPPELEATALEITGAELVARYTASGTDKMPTTNIHRGRYNVITTPTITDADSWYLTCTTRVTKPLIFQDRVPVEFGALESESDAGFMRDEYVYGVRTRFAVGYGDWRLAYVNIP